MGDHAFSDQDLSDAKAILTAAAAAFDEDPTAWIQGSMAMDENGDSLDDFDDPHACAWCAAGMIGHIGKKKGFGTEKYHMACDLLNSIVAPDNVVIKHYRVGDWNDNPNRTLPEVVEAMREAVRSGRLEMSEYYFDKEQS